MYRLYTIIVLVSALFSNHAIADVTMDSKSHQIVLLKQNSKPKFFDDDQQGLCGELYGLMKAELSESDVDLVIDSNIYPIKRILSMLERGEGHVFCGAGRNQQREARFLYSELPIYSVANVVSAKTSASFQLNSIADIVAQDLVVGALHGTSSAAWLKSHEGVRVNDKLHTIEEALEWLALHPEIDLFYYHDLGLNHYVKTLGIDIKVLPTRFRETPQWMIFSKTTPSVVVDELNKSIHRMDEKGLLKKTQNKYLLN